MGRRKGNGVSITAPIWEPATGFKPDAFELVNVRMDTGKIRKAWWTGTAWDSAVGIIKAPVDAWAKTYVSHETMKR